MIADEVAKLLDSLDDPFVGRRESPDHEEGAENSSLGKELCEVKRSRSWSRTLGHAGAIVERETDGLGG
jgi:hypothetical protein